MLSNINSMLYGMTPKPIWKIGSRIYRLYLKRKYLNGKRPYVPGETSKAKGRRLREGFFDKYLNGNGLDIGYGGDPIIPQVQCWDFEHGDAQFLSTLEDEKFDFVYSSHTLEHIPNPVTAIKNWFRVLKRGGYLILYIPHRDLYEKKRTLPSRFNPTHTKFFIIDKDDPPDTIGIIPLIQQNLHGFEIIYAKECSEGHTITDPLLHSNGEYSIEAVLKKIN